MVLVLHMQKVYLIPFVSGNLWYHGYVAELDDKRLFADVVASLEEQLGITGVHQVDNGLEFCILRGELPTGPIAIKVPRDRIFSNVNDAHIDSRLLLDQEFAIMQHLRAQGLTQVPQPISDLEAAGFGALVMSYVPSDGSPPDEFALGQLLARIHTVTPPQLQLSAQEGYEIPELIANRLSRRWKELTVFVPDLDHLPSPQTITNDLKAIADVKRLLHMDFRQANLRTQKGVVLAVVDWSNAVLGHPALELARAAETGETDHQFLKGYASITSLPVVSQRIETIFRLDTATMLALVFLSEAPDPAKVPAAIARVRVLRSQLAQETTNPR
jgi:aminoglycoside phosphotransferase (APT) family kinase protein